MPLSRSVVELCSSRSSFWLKQLTHFDFVAQRVVLVNYFCSSRLPWVKHNQFSKVSPHSNYVQTRERESPPKIIRSLRCQFFTILEKKTLWSRFETTNNKEMIFYHGIKLFKLPSMMTTQVFQFISSQNMEDWHITV